MRAHGDGTEVVAVLTWLLPFEIDGLALEEFAEAPGHLDK